MRHKLRFPTAIAVESSWLQLLLEDEKNWVISAKKLLSVSFTKVPVSCSKVKKKRIANVLVNVKKSQSKIR